jgi:hypothetical protein
MVPLRKVKGFGCSVEDTNRKHASGAAKWLAARRRKLARAEQGDAIKTAQELN